MGSDLLLLLSAHSRPHSAGMQCFLASFTLPPEEIRFWHSKTPWVGGAERVPEQEGGNIIMMEISNKPGFQMCIGDIGLGCGLDT